jgi:hypothetical protein
VHVADPATLVEVAQHDLGNRQADQFTVGEIRSVSTAGAGCDDLVVDQHVKCCEGVQVVGHTSILNTLLLCGDTGRFT